MAKKNYYGVKVGSKIGVFDTWAETSLYVTGYKGAQFKGFATKLEAYEYVGLPFEETKIHTQKEICITNKQKQSNKKNNTKNLLKKYRDAKTDKDKLKFISSLNDDDKNKLYNQLSNKEINYYKKIATDLMDKRFNAVQRCSEVLDYLTTNPKNVDCSVLESKYKGIDLSIPVYTIKAIINVMGESDFSKDDGSSYFNKNATKYYNICKNYWENIWWDTDTGVLSKEEIEKKQYSKYHKDCNKISTISEILRYLNLLNINYFSTRYKLPDLKRRYALNIQQIERRKQKQKQKQEQLKAKKIAEQKKLEAQKKEKELMIKKEDFNSKLNNSILLNNSNFNNIAKSLEYDISKAELMVYRTLAVDKSIIHNISEAEIMKFKQKALRTIEVHSGHEYNKPFIIEAVNVLKNLIL